ncbi:fluoride efflux transporter CrcB [Sphingomonas sp. SUN039]|uniref:fluoride efflux transporter CrcB n=1 Tax=Sphingomonas sp. SUN039 TaxID=2937787 RepID=UPI0021640059|nr:fluoride efflux transporter CrcB [Sphingomonas sp. SUN039]UVO55023.1 fluoride efflux transporter CrcB [Sphingomonas sp. SUN039]
MNGLLAVMIGGALGAGARYLVGGAFLRALGPGFPWGTLAVNLAGGLLMGLLVGILARSSSGGEQARLLLGVGVLGGFTTFSAFGLETWLMIERGQMVVGFAYVAASVVGAVTLTGVGLLLARSA